MVPYGAIACLTQGLSIAAPPLMRAESWKMVSCNVSQKTKS